MKIDRVVLATNNNKGYSQFWPLVASGWQMLTGAVPTLAMIGNLPVRESTGESIYFDPIEGIPTSFSAQVIRLFLPLLFPEDVCLISDIDMLPLNGTYFLENAASINDDCLLIYSSDAYPSGKYRYPMCYIAGKGKTFREILGFSDEFTIADMRNEVKEWYAEGFGWDTDEIIFGRLIHSWPGFPDRCIRLQRGWIDGIAEKRLDRVKWKINHDLLSQGYYIDAHMPVPLTTYIADIKPLLNHVKIDTKELADLKFHHWLLSYTRQLLFYMRKIVVVNDMIKTRIARCG